MPEVSCEAKAKARAKGSFEGEGQGEARAQPSLRDQVRALCENRPGVYRFWGPSGELLYVGKSIQVRTRLLSYFRAQKGEKAAELVRSAQRVDWEYTPSEFAALLAELHSIRRALPMYNVEHKRDRVHCFVKLTREPAARVLLAPGVVADDALYFGPYRGRERVREALRELADLLQLRDCKSNMKMQFADQLELFPPQRSPRCIRGDLGRCLAPCAGRCTQSEYRERVQLAQRFLEGDAERPLAILRSRMETAAERLNYEYAAELRDRAERLEEVKQEMVALRGTIESLSFVYEVAGHDGDDRWYVIRRGTVRAELPRPKRARDRQSALRRARAILTAPEPAPAQVPAHAISEILLIARWFRLYPQEFLRAWPVTGFDALENAGRSRRALKH